MTHATTNSHSDKLPSSRDRSKTGAYAKSTAVGDTYTEYGITMNSGEFDGLESRLRSTPLPRRSRRKALGAARPMAAARRVISRQRYSGCPVPLIHWQRGVVPVPTTSFPSCCLKGWCRNGSGNPYNKTPTFYECKCPVRRARSARDRHHGHFRGFAVVLPALRVP